MNKLQRYGKIVAFDTLAVFCFIGVIAFGWLPGPGGVPLFLIGLSLLAANHDWAERWLETAKYKSKSLKKIIFPDVRWIRYTYDVVSVLLFSGAIYVYLNSDNNIITAASAVTASLSLFLFLLNRDRLDKISSVFKRKNKKT